MIGKNKMKNSKTERIIEKFKPYIEIPEGLRYSRYSHPGIGNAIEVPMGYYAVSIFDPSKEFIHTQSLVACIGLTVNDDVTKLTTLAHITGLSDITKFFNGIIKPLYGEHSQPLEIGLAGGMEGFSEFMLEEIYENLMDIGDFKIRHFEVLDSTGVFDQRDMHIFSERGYIMSGFPSPWQTYVSPDFDTSKSIPSKREFEISKLKQEDRLK